MAKDIKDAGNAGELRDLLPDPDNISTLYRSYWASPEALASAVAAMGDGRHNWTKGAWDPTRERFFGSANMGRALEMCRAGWPEGAARVERLRDRIIARHPTGPRIVKWDVAGAVPSVARALAGNPLNMRRIDSARLRRKPVLTLVSDVANNANIEAVAITNRAAVVAAIVDVIEAQGFACQVLVSCSSRTGKVGHQTACVVKESGVPVDIGRMAFGLGHVAMFRRLCWAAFTADEFTRPLGNSLGVSNAINPDKANARGVYVLPSTESNERAFSSELAAEKFGLAHLIDSLRSQGCPAIPAAEENAA